MKTKSLEIFIDGASEGNPGKSGIGIIFCQNGEVQKNISRYLGVATNNVAEYMALIFALQEALIQKAKNVLVKTDSQLLCNQINKEFKVKNANLKSLFAQAEHLIGAFENFEIVHIPREINKGADKLATKAIREQARVAAPAVLFRFAKAKRNSGGGKSELQRAA